MKLPNFDCAVVPHEKINSYLLSPTHPYGRGKAKFFIRVGFSSLAGEAFVAALLRHVAANPVKKIADSPFGIRYTVEGEMATPDGSAPVIRAVWFIKTGETVPRLVTAYPLGRNRQ